MVYSVEADSSEHMMPVSLRRAFVTRGGPRATLFALILLGLYVPAGGEFTVPEVSDVEAFQSEIATAWESRDLALWMSLWHLPDPEQRAAEEALARRAFASDLTTLEWIAPPYLAEDGSGFTVDAQVFTTVEPEAEVVYTRLSAARRSARWALVTRSEEGRVDGLVHLSLSSRAWKARNVSLHLEDFELRMEDGTLFSNPAPLGVTLLVFVGQGRVLVNPRPPAEAEQLRRFAGSTAIDTPVKWCYLRIDPAVFERAVEVARLEPDAHPPAKRQEEAEQIFHDRSTLSYMVDAPVPRSPWWLIPTRGDAVVDFPWRRSRFPWHRTRVLTFAVSRGADENLNLFDRAAGLQICAYRSADEVGSIRMVHSNADIVDQTMVVRFEPELFGLSAEHRMRLYTRGASTLRLRLHDDFRVSSVSTTDGRSLLFFRVRGQGTIAISLGALARSEDLVTIVTRYEGYHNPRPVDEELLQLSATPLLDADSTVMVGRPPLVYANQTAWYPRSRAEDYSPASLVLDTPEGWLAVTGGQLRSLTTETGRTRTEYLLSEPGKFLTVIVGELSDLGATREGHQTLHTFAMGRQRSYARKLAPIAQEIIAFYSEKFGPCPYPRITLVVAEASVPGGHSPPGLVYLQRTPPLLRRRSLDDPADFPNLPDFFLAHELAHQWWGQGSAPASYRAQWLSEAWAQYAAALWIERRQGESAFRGMMAHMARWARRHDKAGPINLGRRLGQIENDARIRRALVYNKGAWVLHMLRGIVGDEAFFGAARAFLDEHVYAKVTTANLRRALETSSGRDLRPYFARWIDGTGLPVLTWTARSTRVAGGFRTVVEVRTRNAPAVLPLEIRLSTNKGTTAQRVLLDPSGGSWTLDTMERPRRIALNEDRGLLAEVKRVRRLPKRSP